MNKQNKIIIGVIAFILTLTVGYAIFSQSLNITGTAKAEGNLNIIFKEVGDIKAVGANVPTTDITEEGKKLVIGDILLEYPTAYVNLPVTIVNNGTIDGILQGIIVENLETDDIKVSISGIETNQVIRPYDVNDDTTKVNIIVKIEWIDKESVSTLSAKNISIRLNTRQVLTSDIKTTSDSQEVANNCTKFTKKDTYDVGDVVAFCNTNTGKSEDFYVIKDNEDKVTLLAKYNLMVGNKVIYDENFEDYTLEALTSSNKDYGLQSIDTLYATNEEGIPTSTTFYGMIAFANEDENHKNTFGNSIGYWVDKDENLLSKYGSSYPVNVYDKNSNLYEHVENYKTYFTDTLNKKSVTARLIKYDELISLGCDESNETCATDMVINNNRQWIYEGLNYWTASAHDYVYVKNVVFEGTLSSMYYWIGDGFGLRPVIEINKTDI